MKSWEWGDVIKVGGTWASTCTFSDIIARWIKDQRPIISSVASDFKKTKSSVFGVNLVDFWFNNSY